MVGDTLSASSLCWCGLRIRLPVGQAWQREHGTQANDEAAELIDKMLLPVEQKPWKCKGCSVENEPAAEFCQLCGEPCGPNPERVMVPH